ncbi:MAG: hypothetical protein J6Q58_02445 [Clostridia bacterium]|nr:hypothetical protein [Clostridia bacterium]
MADYAKKVIIIKEVLEKVSGSVKLVKENGSVNAQVELVSKKVNLTDLIWCLSGDFNAVIGKTKDVYRFNFIVDSNFSFTNGASFCICDLKSKKMLCYGEFGRPCLNEYTVINYIYNIDLNDKKSEKEDIKSEYDDELIATENYYQNNYEELLFEQIDDVKNKHKEETSKEEIKKQPFSNEKGSCRVENYEYYNRIENKLNEILKNHESITSLNRIIEGGNFVKIKYDKNRSYFVGKIEENKKPKYICYGVSGEYGKYPNGFSSNAHFIPESEFNAEGIGYYFIFQCVHTGEIIN